MPKRDFLSLSDFSREELDALLLRAIELKEERSSNVIHNSLAGKTGLLILAQNSTRTRIAFEAGMNQRGGHWSRYRDALWSGRTAGLRVGSDVHERHRRRVPARARLVALRHRCWHRYSRENQGQPDRGQLQPPVRQLDDRPADVRGASHGRELGEGGLAAHRL